MQKTLCVVDLRAVRRNAVRIKRLAAGVRFYAVVKADAYGHGAEAVAAAIEDVADGFCVALIEEGVALRIAGITGRILVFAPPLDGYDCSRAREYGLTLTASDARSAGLIKSAGAECHLKINTGMNRYGVRAEEADGILRSGLNVCGVYSHLYAPHDACASRRQLELFTAAVRTAESRLGSITAHISASGGLLRGGEYLCGGVRCGILLYGYAPSGFSAQGFERAMKVYARRAQTTEFIGGGVGYCAAEREYGRLGCYRLGYADGFFRGVPLGEGSLCMDAFLSEREGDMLCVMDDADEYAERAGTIPYEVLTSVSRRSERVYIR